MHVVYTRWVDQLHGADKTTFDRLMGLFEQLLQYAAGDASEALRWLTMLDEKYGLGDAEMGIGDFIEELKNRGFLSEDADRQFEAYRSDGANAPAELIGGDFFESSEGRNWGA
jgi:Ca-activated chloride channel family protein